MGCNQSKTSTDQVVERVSVNTPAVEAPAPESIKSSETEVAIEAPPASEDLPPAPASVPVEEAPKTEEPAAVQEVVEEAAEEPSEAVAEEVSVEESAAVEEAPKTEEKTPEAEELPQEETSVETEAPKSEPPVKEAPKSEVPVEEAPKSVEEVAPKSEAALEAVVEEAPVEEPVAEVVDAPASTAKSAKLHLQFKAEDVTFNDKGVAFYNFDGYDSSNPANDVHISKRYSEFKTLRAQLAATVTDLTDLPKASFLQGRKNKKMLDERKTQFTKLLNEIASNPVANQSDAFQAFLA